MYSGWENNANGRAMENANYRNRVQQSGYYKVFYHYLSRLRLHFHELLCSLKCLNKIQKCTKSTRRCIEYTDQIKFYKHQDDDKTPHGVRLSVPSRDKAFHSLTLSVSLRSG